MFAAGRSITTFRLAVVLAGLLGGATPAIGAVLTVGPPAAGSCGGSDCDYQSIQAAIDAASASDTITVYRRTDDATNNYCYNEHITVDKALTIQGSTTTPADAARICPSTGGDIVYITAGDVTIKNLEISGRANDGAGGQNGYTSGGRSAGHGIHVYGIDIDNVNIVNCSINYTFGDNIRYYGDRDVDGDGYMTIKQCYLHHSDTRRNIRILEGGGSASDRHVIRGNLIHTAQGILVSNECNYITIDKNVIKGWPFWGHLASSNFPETRDGSHGGGWRYYSNCPAAIWVTDTDPSNLVIKNNVVLGGRAGIRVNTTGTIQNNTVVNPFNASQYTYNTTIDATKIRDNTYGIMIATGFSGTIQNNIVAVTADNRANGSPGKSSTPYYTPGISGYGIAFENNSGSLSGATISNNNVWGFVDTDGTTALNYGSGITQGASNLSEDPKFSTDGTDESNGGSAPCDADADGTRCYELYEDNFFLSTTRPSGGCHADVWDNVAGAVGFVDLSNGGANDPDTDDHSGLDDCSFAADADNSRAIDFGSGAVGSEPGDNGGIPNLGAFGSTDRASKSPTLRIVGVDVGDGGVKNGDSTAQVPGIVQPRSDGLTTVNVYFNRAVTATSSSFEIRDLCDAFDLTAPVAVDTSGASAPPFNVTLSWNAATFTDQAVRVHVYGDGPDRVVSSNSGSALDGEISDVITGTLPSGNATDGGDAEFVVYALDGDVDGDVAVEGQSGEHDYDAITGYSGYPSGSCSGCPEDLDGDGDVDAADLAVVTGNDNDTPGADWHDSNWNRRRKFRIDSSKVSTVASGDLSSFPVLINSTVADWKDTGNGGDVGQSDGGDILFTSSDGTTKLDHEIESYDPVTGALVAWVEVPSVAAASDTDFFMYYGNAGAADQWNVSGTWDGNHQAVWHFNEDPGDVLEFDTVKAKSPSIAQVSGDVHVIAYTGDFDDGWLATVDINADGSIDNSVIDTLEFDTTMGNDPHIIPLSGDIFALVYQGTTNDGWLVTLDIDASGTPISVVDSVLFESGNLKAPRIIPVAGDIYAVVYADAATKGWVRTFDIATNGTINDSAVATLQIDSRGVTPDITAVSGDIFAIAYSGPTFDGWLATVDIDASGTPISLVDTLEFDTSDGVTPKITAVSGDIYAVAYEGSTGDGFIKTIDIDASGTPLSVVDTLEFDTEDGANPDIVGVGGDIFAVAHEGNDGDGYIKTIDIDASGTPISVVDELEYDADQGGEPAILNTTGDVYAIAHSGTDDDGFLKTVDITSAGLIGEMPDSTSNNAYAQGVTAKVSGQIAGAQDFDGTDDSMRLSNGSTYDAALDATGALSLSLWFYPDDLDSILFDNRWEDAVQENGYHLQTDASGNVVFAAGDNSNGDAASIAVSSSAVTVSQWNHVAVTKASASSTINFYVNGAAAGTDTINNATIAFDSNVVSRILGTSFDSEPYGGSNGFGSKQFTDGKIDELRVSNVQRSADWIVTSYNNQNSPSTFYTVDCEEQP